MFICVSWRPKREYRQLDQYQINKILKKYMILIEGDDPPPPVKSFKDLRLDPRILKVLAKKKLLKPTPI